jgi:hypothetical protein
VLTDLNWISLYRVNVRMVDRFRVGRVLLAGDAAHVHSSASGQGLNTSASVRLFDLFRGPHFTLLGFGARGVETLAEFSQRHGSSVHAHPVVRPADPPRHAGILDTEGEAARNYGLDPDADVLVLIRPDGYVGVIADPDRTHLLQDYLGQVTVNPTGDRPSVT